MNIWYKDPKEFLLNPETIVDIIPSKSQVLVQQLNSFVRLAVYFSVIVYVLKRDSSVFFFPIFVGLITFFIYENRTTLDLKQRELFSRMNVTEDGQCVKPTKENPFMNVSYVDYNDFPNRPPACNITNKEVKEEVQEILEESCYRDYDDVYGRKANDRQFYTNPITTIPNDQGGFANWLYNSGKETCKEKSIQCWQNIS